MKHDDQRQSGTRQTGPPGGPDQVPTRSAWVEPKLEFVEPRLTMHGDLHRVTGAFFGTFSP